MKLSEERVSESKEIPGDISVKRLRIKTEKKNDISNNIKVMVLTGVREWEERETKAEKCEEIMAKFPEFGKDKNVYIQNSQGTTMRYSWRQLLLGTS